jgi:hypoxanthine phosphoribosyltransferase
LTPDCINEVLLTEDEIQIRTRELGKKISEDYLHKNLLLVGILKGSFIFLADLARCIDIPLSIDFVTLSSYNGSTESSGVVEMLTQPRDNIAGKDVILVEDIVDTGWTIRLSRISEFMQEKGAASVGVCTLLDKPSRRQVGVEIDYTGFVIPDKFVVGYGLDLNGLYRNLKFIGCIDSVERKSTP